MEQIKLLPDEQKMFELEADFWIGGNNPLMTIISNIIRIIAKILGTKIQGKLIITNSRAIVVKETIRLYCIHTDTEVKLLTKRSIQEIGYQLKKTCLVFCPTYYLFYVGKDQTVYIEVPNSTEKKINEILNNFYNVIN